MKKFKKNKTMELPSFVLNIQDKSWVANLDLEKFANFKKNLFGTFMNYWVRDVFLNTNQG